MPKKQRKSETVKVSRLGCMRKSTVESALSGKMVEHIELWTDLESSDASGGRHGKHKQAKGVSDK